VPLKEATVKKGRNDERVGGKKRGKWDKVKAGGGPPCGRGRNTYKG